ncbi:hypothetical protein [Streptomyces tubercidicus]|uniref:hypothetical protein n=1 Tax=Streptomyces tubercidicus TaxID=47759 RepID=UPI0013583C97|nr:hypothetical protein [Streptomyces tubercidicus]WAU09987.1 hypothetical protein STRTU_000020 [Streptomyces tubercidicus]WAU16340.1 hypothetical protein STRTU_007152 [Streptomyces tubercidicus]
MPCRFVCRSDAADEAGADLITDVCRVVEACDLTLLDRVPAAHWLQWLPGLWKVPGGYALLSSALQRAAAHDEGATTAFLTRTMTSDVTVVAFHQRHMRLPQLSAQALDCLNEGHPRPTPWPRFSASPPQRCPQRRPRRPSVCCNAALPSARTSARMPPLTGTPRWRQVPAWRRAR